MAAICFSRKKLCKPKQKLRRVFAPATFVVGADSHLLSAGKEKLTIKINNKLFFGDVRLSSSNGKKGPLLQIVSRTT